MNNPPLLHCEQLSKSYQDGNTQTIVLNNVCFSLQAGELASIVGSSGSGKSTLLHLLGGLDLPSSGEIRFQGQAMSQLSETAKAALRNHQLGFIYQFHHLLADFTALENIAMPLLIAKKPRQQALQQASDMLRAVGLAARASHRPAELSGGERQRVAIARALVNQPALVLADEPTGNLDSYNADAIFDLLIELNQKQATAFLVVTHDMQLAKRLGRQMVMNNGQLLAGNTATGVSI